MPEKYNPIWTIDEFDRIMKESYTTQGDWVVVSSPKLHEICEDDPLYLELLVEMIRLNNGVVLYDPMNDTYKYRICNPATFGKPADEITHEQYTRLKNMVMKDKEEKEDGWNSI